MNLQILDRQPVITERGHVILISNTQAPPHLEITSVHPEIGEILIKTAELVISSQIGIKIYF